MEEYIGKENQISEIVERKNTSDYPDCDILATTNEVKDVIIDFDEDMKNDCSFFAIEGENIILQVKKNRFSTFKENLETFGRNINFFARPDERSLSFFFYETSTAKF